MFHLQADAVNTNGGGDNVQQYNLQLLNYLSGNLNLYVSNRFSLMISNNFIYNPLIGFKVVKNLWFEVSGAFGNQLNYSEADGLYLYNGVDPTQQKFTSSAYITIGKKAILNLNYIYEKKNIQVINFNYL